MTKKPKHHKYEDEPEEEVIEVELVEDEPVEGTPAPQDIPPNLQVSPSTIGPIVGVVDGSDAAPGQVGEFLKATGTVSFAAYPTITNTSVLLINMPPGDWDLWISGTASTNVGGLFFTIAPPVPAGMSNKMEGFFEEVGATAIEVGSVIIGMSARGSFAVTSALTFTVLVDQSLNNTLVAGTVTLQIEARRRR